MSNRSKKLVNAKSPKRSTALIGTATVFGSLAGIAVGTFGGPPGAVAGGLIGGLVGMLAGAVFTGEAAREREHDNAVDKEIGVIGARVGEPLPGTPRTK